MKSYLILEANLDSKGKIIDSDPLKLKVRRGYLADDLIDVLDIQDEWTPGDEAERPYFFPGCNVPRFKVRENFNITIKPEYATAAFISVKTLKGSDDGFNTLTRMVKHNGHDLMKWLNFIYPANHAFLVKAQSLFLNCETDVMLNADDVPRLTYYRPTDFACHYTKADERSMYQFTESKYGDRGVTIFTPQPNSIMSRLTCPIYDEKAILKILNKDCIVIDKIRYEELCLMGRSNDKDNLATVMELMANCDFDKSCVYLLMLIKKFGHEMYKLPGINHVNFKSLLEYLYLDAKNLRGILRGHKVDYLTIDMLLSSLKSLGKWNSSDTQKIVSLFPLDTSNDRELNKDHEYVTQGYTLKEEYISQLDDEEVIEDDEEIEVDNL